MRWFLLAVALLAGAGLVLGLVALSLWRRSRQLIGELSALGDAIPTGPAGSLGGLVADGQPSHRDGA